MTVFTRTLRSLEADRSVGSITGMLVAIALVAAWVLWSIFARVVLYETTRDARLETDQVARRVQSPLVGKVVQTRLELGREVHAGEVLLELDASPEQFQAAEEQARLQGVRSEIAALRQQLDAETRTGEAEKQSGIAAADEAHAAVGETESAARFASAQDERARALRSEGVTSEEESARLRSSSEQAAFAVARARAAIRRIEQDQLTRAGDRATRRRELEVAITRLEGDADTLAAKIRRLDNEVERRIVRAPIDGLLAEVATVREGAVLDEGETIASLLPAGTLRVVAQFAPMAAFGRINVGQRANLRLDGFPWAEYGAVALRVVRVASEIRDGSVRVELELDGAPPPRIPLQHGLAGTVEVETEHVTPARLILRAAGQLWGAPLGEVSPVPTALREP